MEPLRYSPRNRESLLAWLRDEDTPKEPDPRSWIAQADMYQQKYGPDEEIEEASQLLQDRLARGS